MNNTHKTLPKISIDKWTQANEGIERRTWAGYITFKELEAAILTGLKQEPGMAEFMQELDSMPHLFMYGFPELKESDALPKDFNGFISYAVYGANEGIYYHLDMMQESGRHTVLIAKHLNTGFDTLKKMYEMAAAITYMLDA